MSVPLRALIVEDSERDAQLLIREFKRRGYEPSYERVETPEAMLAALDGKAWDVIIADYVLPRFSGLAALQLMKERRLDLPFIIVSGKVGEETAVVAMKAGAHDYITKGSLARLVPALEREMRDAAVRRERRQLEEHLRRAQRLEMAGRLAAQVAHDFGNLLTPMIGYSQLIKRRLPADHPAVEYCDALLKSARQMAALNEDMLTLGRRGRLNEEPVDLNYLVKQAVTQMPERPEGLDVQLDLARDLRKVSGSPVQLSRVVSNLLSNACEAMQDAGLIRIVTANFSTEQPVGHYNRVEPGEYARLTVSDTGCGIPPDVVDKIFDPFFTTKHAGRQSGSGLGLSIVRAIVEDHNGHVDLESEVGRGTAFYAYLPALPQAEKRTA